MTTDPGDAVVVDATDENRFVIRGDRGLEAELVYRAHGDRLVLIHTGVPEEWGGRGIGARLVRAAMDRARAEHLTVVPWCPFARRWLHGHPDETAGVTIDWDTTAPD
jgi:hypothetical protein